MLFGMLRRIVTGEVLHAVEVPVSNAAATFRLKLKRERATGELYVTLALTSIGRGDYQYLGRDQFRDLVAAVQETQAAMEAAEAQQLVEFKL